MANAWFISANGDVYDHESAFKRFGFIDWVQHLKDVTVGDYVVIYATGNPKLPRYVRYVCTVVKASMSFSEAVDDSEFWHTPRIERSEYMRLKIVKEFDSDYLSLSMLQAMGIRPPQKQVHLPDKLKSYCGIGDECDYPESDGTSTCIEGAVEQVLVNRFERNPIARQKCIEANGCYCHICGMDFEKSYGEYGRGFIHVHHIIPLNKIREEYEVDPVNDLIPLCPNCHAMVHRSRLSVDELRDLYLKNN